VLIRQDGTVAWAVTGYRPSNHVELENAVEELFPDGCPKADAEEGADAETGSEEEAVD